MKGLDVKVEIVEGGQFKMGTVTVRGAMTDDSKHLLRVAKVPQMGIVDFEQLRNAAARMRDSLRHDGYLDAEVSTDRDINDEKKTVDVFFVPHPGVQYTFGKLDVQGLGLDGVAAIQKMWTVKTGDPFPGEYPDYFVKEVKEQGLFDNLGDAKADQDINAETHVVNVTLNFKYDPDHKPKKRPGGPMGEQLRSLNKPRCGLLHQISTQRRNGLARKNHAASLQAHLDHASAGRRLIPGHLILFETGRPEWCERGMA